MKRAVFLDRDGVINRSLRIEGRPIAPRTLSEFRLLPGASQHIARLKRRGFLVVVVTNQPDVGRGLVARAVVEAMNRRLLVELGVDLVKVCMHAQDGDCRCRKPAAGMLLDAGAELGIALERSYMVGDRWSDVEAGRAVRCYTVRIERHWANEKPSQADAVVRSLGEAVRHILDRERRSAKQ